MMAFIATHWRALVAALLAILVAWALHFAYNLGQQHVQMQWDLAKVDQTQQAATITETYRLRERAAAQQAVRIDHDTQDKHQAASVAAAAAHAAAAGVRATVDTLFGAGAATTAASVASLAGQARTASDLLATCTDRYASVAEAADDLAIQVTGLQDFVATAWPVVPP